MVLIGVGYLCLDNLKEVNTYIQCCGGNQCSDTYYTAEDNLCHLTLCENSLISFQDKSQCTYQGANISINMT